MITLFWGFIFLFFFVLLIWYLETCVEVYTRYRDAKRNKQDRNNARYIQKVDRYYNEF